MTREAKIGLMMIAILVGVFGFLVYKRIHRPSELRAGSGIEVADRGPSAAADLIADDEVEPNDAKSPEPVRFERAVKKPKADFDDVIEEDLAQVESEVLEQRLQDQAKRDEDRPQSDREWTSSRRNRDIELPEPAEESGTDETELSTTARQSEALQPPNDPFDNGPSIEDEKDDDAEPLEIRQVKAESRSPEFSSSDEASIELPALEEKGRPDSPGSDRQRLPESATGHRRRAAPGLSDDSPFDSDSSPVRKTAGESYTVEPNDNFWSISRKRYGVGRYYMALATHNRQTVPDPKRMKPGLVISTPDASFLEKRYPESFPKTSAEPAESSASEYSTHRHKSSDSERPGYFVGDNGEPMYRIGPKDTLSEIAKNHLNRSSRWVQILKMNRDVLKDGNELKVGTVLRLPADACQVRVAESGSDFR